MSELYPRPNLPVTAPLVNFWSHLSQQGITVKSDVAIPAGDVFKVIKDTLVLIGNASNYITRTRRMNFIDSINGAHQKLAIFPGEVTRDDIEGTDGDLFGPQVRKKLTDRADTIEAFNKAIKKVENTPTPYKHPPGENRFLAKRPSATYGSNSGRRSYIPYNRGTTPRGRQYRQPQQREGHTSTSWS